MASSSSSTAAASPAASCWTCELSGEPLLATNNDDEVVVTPSGHVCWKRLLLAKLADNGGKDPFTEQRLLSEDDLITLNTNSNRRIIPPRPLSATSMPSLLGLVGKEYESLALELFDTRKVLEETRKELSHALYQNDAAVRVVARLSMERDVARQQLAQWKAQDTSSSSAGPSSVVVQEESAQEDEQQEPPAKRAKMSSDAVVVPSSSTKHEGIPQDDLDLMTSTWERLSKERKMKKKSIVIPSMESLQQLLEVDKKNWHKTKSKAGIVGMKFSPTNKQLVTAGRDKQLVVYSLDTKQLVHTIGVGTIVSHLDVNTERIVAVMPPPTKAKSGSTIVQYVDGTQVGNELHLPGSNDSALVVDVALHPTGKHIVVTMENKTIVFCGIRNDDDDNTLKVITTFSVPSGDDDDEATTTYTYSSGTLHPDGLIAAAGTSNGAVHLWDFKNQTLADTLKSEETKDSAIVGLAFSSNGYHLAVATDSLVQVRDIRKGKVLMTVQGTGIHCVAFDVSGKYLSFGGKEGVTIVTAKEGTAVTTVGTKTQHVNNIVWTSETQLVTTGDADRQVRFYGLENSKEGDRDVEMND